MQNAVLLDRFSISLGGMVISITAVDEQSKFSVDAQRQYFSSNGTPDINIRVCRKDVPPVSSIEKKMFASGGLWSLSVRGDEYVFYVKSDFEKQADRQALFSSDFRSGDVWISTPDGPLEYPHAYPLEFPLDEVLMVILLSLNSGALIHACGVIDKGRGLLFAGISGAGKSTVANLYKKHKDAAILSDDRIIVRKDKGSFYIYGTPWHGDADVCSPDKTVLDGIYFLKHGRENSVTKLSPADALSRLVPCSFAPFWEKNWMNSALAFCAGLVQSIPSYELTFLPDESILELLGK